MVLPRSDREPTLRGTALDPGHEVILRPVSTLVLCGALAMVAVTAWLTARRLGLRTKTALLLSAYVIGSAEIVAISLALSAFDAFRSWTVVCALAFAFAGALALSVNPLPASHGSGSASRAVREATRDPIVVVLGLAVLAGLVYSAGLALFTPPNDWDALTYHLARAAFWIQQHGVGYVPDSDVLRINVNPPNAEIGSAFAMLLSNGDRYVGFGQYSAALATGLGIYGMAGRLGLRRSEALFGALAFLSVPVVLLQSSTALNDLVVASFLVAATYFLVGETRAELTLGAVALALALGTKFTAFIALPLLALVVLSGQPRQRWGKAALAGLVGTCAGSYWLVVNLVATGSVDGGAGDVLEQHPDRSPAPVLARSTRMLVGFADDLSGGRDLRLYGIAAVIVAAVVVTAARGRRAAWLAAMGVVAVGCVPFALAATRERLLQTHEKLWLTLGERDLAFLDTDRDASSPSTVFSYFGPLGFTLVLAGVLVVVVARRRGAAPRLALLLAAAPVLMVPLTALALVYDPWRGRFLLYGLALGAATWGLVLRHRWLAWGMTSLATVTVVLTFVHSIEKPAGVRIFNDRTSAGVWGEPRDVVQTWLRRGGTAEVVGFFSRERPAGRVGLEVGEDDWVYPYFGRSLSRDVVFARDREAIPSLDWLVVRPGRGERPGRSWSLALATKDGWRVYQRSRPSDRAP